MQLYLAPLEGITGYIVRNAFLHHFGHIDKYFTPFIPAAKRMNKKILRDIDPANNRDIHLVPQLLSNRADEVLSLGHQLRAFGYEEINLNLGCPSGTVVSKKRGSGLLAYPEELQFFLDELYEKADMKISIKTRIGFDSPKEWERLLQIYTQYPMAELIIHPRIQKDFYKNKPCFACFQQALDAFGQESRTPVSICYNGDITSLESYQTLLDTFPSLDCIMIGRGLLSDPTLAESIAEYQKGDVTASFPPSDDVRWRRRVKAFLDEIFQGYAAIFSGEKDAMFHMKELWFYLGNSFPNDQKLLKQIRKCQTYPEYQLLMNEIFRLS